MSLLYPAGERFGDANLDPVGAGKLYVYDNGTPDQASIWSDPELTVAITQPAVLDSGGLLQTNVYVTDGTRYTVKLDDSDDAEVFTRDNTWGWEDSLFYSVANYGAVGDGSTDDTTAIQAAIDAIGTAGGGDLHFDSSVYLISSTLIIDWDNVRLVGAGSGAAFRNTKALQRSGAATTIKWNSAITGDVMIRFTSNAADDGTGYVKGGGGMKGFFIDGAETATYGLEIITWWGGQFDDIFVEAVTDRMYNLDCLANDVVAGTNTIQHNSFTNILGRVKNLTGNTAHGLVMGGPATASGNTSFNHFSNVHIETEDGDAIVFANTDNNLFYNLRGKAAGSGNALVFHADDTGPDNSTRDTHARFNRIFGAELDAPVVAKATVAGSNHSFANEIYGLSASNNAPKVTIETGAKVFIIRNGGADNTYANAGTTLFGRQRRGVEASISSNQSITQNSTTEIVWNVEDRDDDGAFDGDDPDFVIPDGVYAAEFHAGIEWGADATGYRWLQIEQNNATIQGAPKDTVAGISGVTLCHSVSTGEITVAPGDTMRVRVRHSSSGSINAVTGKFTFFKARWL